MARQPSIDPLELRQAFSCFPSGVTAVCGLVAGAPAGLAASSFTSVSLEPPLLLIAVAHTSTTWPRLRPLPRLGVSVFAEGQDEACRALSSKSGDRFAGISWEATAEGAIWVRGTAAWFDCSESESIRAGDHDLVVLRIHRVETFPDVKPLVFHASRFRQLTQ